MTTRRAIFLDVDGTLVNEAGRVPLSAQAAIEQARRNGHLVFMCTGRSTIELWPDLLAIGFDGLILASGAYVKVGEEILAHRQLPSGEIAHILDYFAAHDTPVYFQANDGIHARSDALEHLKEVIRRGSGDEAALTRANEGIFAFVDSIRTDTDFLRAGLTKAIYFDSSLSVEEVSEEFAGGVDVTLSSIAIFGVGSGELTIAGVHKASGIDLVCARLGVDLADTIGIGDSYNDLEMLAHVGIGIAMGNAPEAVRRTADELTATPDGDGIALAFARHGLVGD